MKQLKTGFTLAEVLLAIAIIGVVTAMGMMITKESATKAYNLFYYTGYENLYNAILESKFQNESSKTKVNSLLGTTENLVDGNKVVASNGITYTFVDDSIIKMTVPIPRKKGETDENYTVAFSYNDDNSSLIPLVPAEGYQGPNLQERRDLLLAFIDDGIVGRNNVLDRQDWNYKAPRYASYKDVYCSLYDTMADVIDCTGATDLRSPLLDEMGNQIRDEYGNVRYESGVLKVVNPNRVK